MVAKLKPPGLRKMRELFDVAPTKEAIGRLQALLEEREETVSPAEDRSAAIFASAVVEYNLKHFLLVHLPNAGNKYKGKERFQDKLFKEGGPLDTFASRILMAHLLGIIDRETYDQLEIVRQIRNVFAHAFEPTFATREIALECKRLKPFALLKNRFKLSTSLEDEATSRQLYLGTCICLALGFVLERV